MLVNGKLASKINLKKKGCLLTLKKDKKRYMSHPNCAIEKSNVF